MSRFSIINRRIYKFYPSRSSWVDRFSAKTYNSSRYSDAHLNSATKTQQQTVQLRIQSKIEELSALIYPLCYQSISRYVYPRFWSRNQNPIHWPRILNLHLKTHSLLWNYCAGFSTLNTKFNFRLVLSTGCYGSADCTHKITGTFLTQNRLKLRILVSRGESWNFLMVAAFFGPGRLPTLVAARIQCFWGALKVAKCIFFTKKFTNLGNWWWVGVLLHHDKIS